MERNSSNRSTTGQSLATAIAAVAVIAICFNLDATHLTHPTPVLERPPTAVSSSVDAEARSRAATRTLDALQLAEAHIAEDVAKRIDRAL